MDLFLLLGHQMAKFTSFREKAMILGNNISFLAMMVVLMQ
jgi:hypothetical protein